MARRRKTDPFDDLMGGVAQFPWWAGVALAILSYLFFHWLAQPVPVVALQPGQVAGAIYRSVLGGLATGAQYMVPVLCLSAAIVSALSRHKRAGLLNEVAQSTAADALDSMSWHEFEMIVGEAFRLQGYAVTETGGGGADGGVDLVLRKGTEKSLVQCKQWKAFKVGVQPVRELYGVMAAKGAAGGFMVTSGRFTEDATEFASGRNLTLIDGPKLIRLIQQAESSLAGTGMHSTQAAPRPVQSTAQSIAEAEHAAQVCPVCSRAMVLRIAKRGANAGRSFWGCSGYPDCKGTRAAT